MVENTTLILTNEYAPLILLINGLAILFYFGARKKAKDRAMKFGNYETLEKVAGRHFLHSSEFILVLRILALTFLLVGISGPLLVTMEPSTDADYVIAIDSSASMFTGDIEPTRFDAATEISSNFVNELPEQTQVGLVSYSGQVENQTELTRDHASLQQQINSLRIGETAGTAMGDAIIASSSLMTEGNNNQLILVTDGKNNQGATLNESVQFAQRNNVTINPIGLGETNQTIDVEVEELEGESLEFPNLEEERLADLGNQTNGKVSFVSDRESFEAAFDEVTLQEVERDVSQYFIFGAAFLLLLEWIMSTTRIKVIP